MLTRLQANLENMLQNENIDAYFEQGKSWYKNARITAYEISKETSVPYRNVCGIIAALSPRNRWTRNIADARQICTLQEEYRLGKYATFSTNVEKAYAILNASSVSQIKSILNGDKTVSFFDNIYNAESEKVTIDLHIQLAAMGKYLPTKERPKITKKFYLSVEKAIKNIASNHGLKPYEMQAIVWLAWKKRET